MKHLQHIFITLNGYPKWVALDKLSATSSKGISGIPSNANQHILMLGYKRKKGENKLSNIEREINKLLVVSIGTKVGGQFNINDKTKKEHQYDLTY